MPIYSDIDMNLYKQTDGDITKDEDVSAIFNALENIVMTIQGSRRMRPDFAYGPHNFLFEPINAENAQRLGGIINSCIEQYENRINVTNTHISYDNENNLYEATINFVLLGRTNVIETVNFILKRV
jgi:phage baseplate assembly protein W